MTEESLWVVSVEEGQRYRLHKIRFLNEDDNPLHFPESELRAQIPLRDGDIFYVARIRDGLEALKRLYASHGYIDFTASPQTETDDGTEVLLILRLHPSRQFRISRITVLGLPPKTLVQLKWRIKEGDVFRLNDYVAFFADNRDLLPKGASESNVEFARDLRAGTVALTFVFARCEPYPY